MATVQRGSTQKTTRFRGPTEVTLRGAGSSGNDPLVKGTGTDIGFRIAIPVTQTAPAFQIEQPEGTVIYTLGGSPTTITASGALPVQGGTYMITNAAATALTLAAPTAAQNGTTITVTSATAFAHTITATGLLQTGSAAVNVATFAAFAGASVTLRAYNGFWQVVSSTGVTFS